MLAEVPLQYGGLLVEGGHQQYTLERRGGDANHCRQDNKVDVDRGNRQLLARLSA